MQIPDIHFTAWEQAVFVCLMIVLVSLMLSWQSRESRALRDFQAEQEKKRLESELKRDREWREWMDKNQRIADLKLEAVQQSIEGLVTIVKMVSIQVDAHRTEFAVAAEEQMRILSNRRAGRKTNAE